jgi:hypothetical protein
MLSGVSDLPEINKKKGKIKMKTDKVYQSRRSQSRGRNSIADYA